MSALTSSHFRMRSLQKQSQCDDSRQSTTVPTGCDGHINVKHLVADILATEGDTDSDEEYLPVATRAAPHMLQTREVNATVHNRTVVSESARSDTSVGGKHPLSGRNDVEVGASSVLHQWPNAEKAKARLIEIVEKLFGTSRAVSYQSVQSVYHSRYGVPLDDKEVQKLFGTQPAMKALREHCLDAFEISQMGSDFGLKAHKKLRASSTSTPPSVQNAPSMASARQNTANGIPCTFTVSDVSAAYVSDSGRAKKVPPPRTSEVHPRKGAHRPAVMQPSPRPMSCAPFSTQANSTALATDKWQLPALTQQSRSTESPNGANRKSSVFKPIDSGSTLLPFDIVPPARNATLSLKETQRDFTYRGDGRSDKENERSDLLQSLARPTINEGFRKELQAPRAASTIGVVSRKDGTRAASVANSQRAPLRNQSNTASAGGCSQSIFARRPPSILPIPKPTAMRSVTNSVPHYSLDQRQAVPQTHVAKSGQTASNPISACHGVVASSHAANNVASSHHRMSVAKGSAIGAKDEGHRASVRLGSSEDKLQHVRHIVLALVQYRHPSPTPLTDVVQVLEQASSNGCGVKDVLGTSTLEFVGTLDGMKIYEERGLVFCALDTQH